MLDFLEHKDRISLLGRAEYRYDRLVCDFAEHYLELERSGYSPLPEIAAFHQWLSHLHREIRPSLLSAQQSMASHFGFQLGDHVKTNGIELYVFTISCYPLESIIRLAGYSVKKNGKPAQSSTFVEVNEASIVEQLPGSITPVELDSLLFPSSTRLPHVNNFIQSSIDHLP